MQVIKDTLDIFVITPDKDFRTLIKRSFNFDWIDKNIKGFDIGNKNVDEEIITVTKTALDNIYKVCISSRNKIEMEDDAAKLLCSYIHSVNTALIESGKFNLDDEKFIEYFRLSEDFVKKIGYVPTE